MEIKVYTSDRCGWCDRAKMLLDENNMPYTSIEVTYENGFDLAQKIAEARGTEVDAVHLTVPQIFFDGRLIGGYSDLEQWIRERDD